MDFSIVIPTYSNTTSLPACLAAFARQTYPADRFEVIVVDDGSPTPARPIIEKVQNRVHLHLIEQPNAGPATARNRGAQKASGKYLAFIDDDCRPHPGWLAALIHRVERFPDGLIGGKTINLLENNIYSAASQVLIDFLYDHFLATDSPYRFFTSNNLAMQTCLFDILGGFDERMPLAAGEDREFSERWRQNGFSMVFAPEAVVYHAHALDLRSFYWQHFNYGRGAWLYHQIRKTRWGRQFAIPPSGFYPKMMLHPHRLRRPCPFRLSALILLSQIANTAGFLSEQFHKLLGNRWAGTLS